MSETNTFKGKLNVVTLLPDESLEAACRRIAIFCGKEEKPDYFKSYEDFIRNDSDDYIVANDCLYQVTVKSQCDYDDIFEASKNEDGSISYLVQYYNGGCGFAEAIEYALKNLDK